MPLKITEASLEIVIDDVNDNDPVFTVKNYTGVILVTFELNKLVIKTSQLSIDSDLGKLCPWDLDS